jgi:hypothetical protein
MKNVLTGIVVSFALVAPFPWQRLHAEGGATGLGTLDTAPTFGRLAGENPESQKITPPTIVPLGVEECEKRGIPLQTCLARVDKASVTQSLSLYSSSTGVLQGGRNIDKLTDYAKTPAAEFAASLNHISGASGAALIDSMLLATTQGMHMAATVELNKNLAGSNPLQQDLFMEHIRKCMSKLQQEQQISAELAYDYCVDPVGNASVPETIQNTDSNPANVFTMSPELLAGPRCFSQQLLEDIQDTEEAINEGTLGDDVDTAEELKKIQLMRQSVQDYTYVCGDFCYSFDNEQATNGVIKQITTVKSSTYSGPYGKGANGLVMQFEKEAYDALLRVIFSECTCLNDMGRLPRSHDPLDPTPLCADTRGALERDVDTVRTNFNSESFSEIASCLWEGYQEDFKMVGIETSLSSLLGLPIQLEISGFTAPGNPTSNTYACSVFDPDSGPYSYDALFTQSSSGVFPDFDPSSQINNITGSITQGVNDQFGNIADQFNGIIPDLFKSAPYAREGESSIDDYVFDSANGTFEQAGSQGGFGTIPDEGDLNNAVISSEANTTPIPSFFRQLKNLATALSYQRFIRTRNEALASATNLARTSTNPVLLSTMQRLCEQMVSERDITFKWLPFVRKVESAREKVGAGQCRFKGVSKIALYDEEVAD